MTDAPRRLRFSAAQRLHGSDAFAAVFDGRCRKNVWPLSVCSIPNRWAYNRLGLSVGRKVGTAVVRNRIKRLIREAFRLGQNDGPAGYDLVVIVRPHDPLPLAEYQRLLAAAIESVDREWRKRARRQEERSEDQQPGSPDESPR